TGALLPTFLTPLANPDGRFGSAVAIAGSAVLIGAPFDDTGAADAGIAYLFDAASGVVLATFENPTPAPGDQFGASLAADGNLVVVGSWLDDTAAPNAGAVYVFTDQVFPSSSTSTPCCTAFPAWRSAAGASPARSSSGWRSRGASSIRPARPPAGAPYGTSCARSASLRASPRPSAGERSAARSPASLRATCW